MSCGFKQKVCTRLAGGDGASRSSREYKRTRDAPLRVFRLGSESQTDAFVCIILIGSRFSHDVEHSRRDHASVFGAELVYLKPSNHVNDAHHEVVSSGKRHGNEIAEEDDETHVLVLRPSHAMLSFSW